MEVDHDDYKHLLQIKNGDFANIPDSLLQELSDNLILVEKDLFTLYYNKIDI